MGLGERKSKGEENAMRDWDKGRVGVGERVEGRGNVWERGDWEEI